MIDKTLLRKACKIASKHHDYKATWLPIIKKNLANGTKVDYRSIKQYTRDVVNALIDNCSYEGQMYGTLTSKEVQTLRQMYDSQITDIMRNIYSSLGYKL